MVDTMEQAVSAALTYLEQPELHQEKRRWLVDFVCHKVDGRCGARFAEALKIVCCVKRLPRKRVTWRSGRTFLEQAGFHLYAGLVTCRNGRAPTTGCIQTFVPILILVCR